MKHMEGPTYATVGGLSQDASAVQLSRESPFLPLMNSATVRFSHDAHLHACAGSFCLRGRPPPCLLSAAWQCDPFQLLFDQCIMLVLLVRPRLGRVPCRLCKQVRNAWLALFQPVTHTLRTPLWVGIEDVNQGQKRCKTSQLRTPAQPA